MHDNPYSHTFKDGLMKRMNPYALLLLLLAFVAWLAMVTPGGAQTRSNGAIADDLARLAAELRLAPPPSPQVIVVPSGVDLGTVVVSEVRLAPDGVYPGFTLKHSIIIHGALGLDGLSGRMTRAFEGTLPLIKGQIIIPAGVSHIALEGVEVFAQTAQDLIIVEGSYVSFDHVLVHGQATGTKRGIAMNGDHIELRNSSVYDFKLVGQDSQAVAGWNGAGPFLIDNNYLEAACENVIFGGTDPSTPGLIPSDITLTNNTITKPLTWKGSVWSVKNLLELKNAQRVLIAHNDFSNSWKAGQGGYAVALTVRNQDNTCPWCTIADVEISDNQFTHMGAGINILGRDDTHPSATMSNVVIARNRFDDINVAAWGGDGRALFIQGGPSNLQIINDVFVQGGATSLNSFFSFDQPQYKLVGLVVRGSEFSEGTYGVFGGGVGTGRAVLDAYAPGYVWETVTVHKGTSGENYKYPVGTVVVP
jgi:hypothetical protein